MPAPQNLSFEVSSGTPLGGGAAGWTLAATVAAYDWALFDEVRGYEAFETGWDGNEAFVRALDLGTLEAAHFATLDGEPLFFEGFDREWNGNEDFEWDFAGLEALPPETFEGWVTAYAVDLSDLEALPAEDFETWGTYFFTYGGTSAWDSVAMGNAAAAWSGAAGYAAEAFADVRPGVPLQGVDLGTDTLVCNDHTFNAGERVRLTGSPPAPLAAGVWYFVLNPVPGATFQVAASSGGEAIDLTAPGGEATVDGDPARYWIRVMRTI